MNDPAPVTGEDGIAAAVAALPSPLPVPPDLVLRPLTQDDARTVATWRGLAEVARYTSRPPMSPAETETFIAGRLARPTSVAWGIERAGRLVGEVGGSLSPAPSLAGPTGWWEMSLAYTLHPDATGSGVATAAARALCSHVFAHLPVRRITAECFADHGASARVLEKVGLRLEGRRRASCLSREGVWWDDLSFAVLREEWPTP